MINFIESLLLARHYDNGLPMSCIFCTLQQSEREFSLITHLQTALEVERAYNLHEGRDMIMSLYQRQDLCWTAACRIHVLTTILCCLAWWEGLSVAHKAVGRERKDVHLSGEFLWKN